MKRILNYFKNGQKPSSASLAKERLQIIISHERGKKNNRTDFLTLLQQELVAVIAKYLKVNPEQVKEQVRIDLAHEGKQSVLELNITIPDQDALNSNTDA